MDTMIDNLKCDLNHSKLIEWGDDCKAWLLLDKANMSVVYEEMPPNTAEALHYHEYADQFFYVLSGELKIEMNENEHYLNAGKGIFMPKKTPHRVFNNGQVKVEFILFSSPNPFGDRVDL